MSGDIHAALDRITNLLHHHTHLLEIIMSGEDDLKQAIADNAAALTAVEAEISDLSAKILAGATGQDPDADIEALAKQLQVQTAQLKLVTQNATNPQPAPVEGTGGAAVPQAPAPAPAAQGA